MVSWDTFHFFSNITENIYDIGRFRIDTTRKGNPSSTPSRGRLGQYTGHVGTVLNACVLRAHSQ